MDDKEIVRVKQYLVRYLTRGAMPSGEAGGGSNCQTVK